MGDEYSLTQPRLAFHENDHPISAIASHYVTVPQGSYTNIGLRRKIVRRCFSVNKNGCKVNHILYDRQGAR